VGVVDWPNSVFYSFYGFQPIEQLTLEMTRVSTDNFVFENGYTYASVQWNKAVTELFGPTQPAGEGHNRLAYGTIEQSADAFQILTDAANWLRKPQFTGSSLAPPRASEQVLSSGFSQTAALQLEFLSTGRNVTAAGKSVYDGHFVQMTGLVCYKREDVAPVFGDFGGCDTFPRAGKSKVMVIASESDFPLLGAFASRADGTDPNYIQYELAGVSHIPKPVIDVSGFGATRQNHASSKPFSRGALHNLTQWARVGKAPPPSSLIDSEGGNIARDADGNATGGVRLPHLTNGNAGAPSGAYSGVEPAGLDPFNLFLLFSGTYDKFTDASLVARYPNCASYTSKVTASANALFTGGYITVADRDAYINGTPELAGTSAWSFSCTGSTCTCQDN
jgi:hypothetical protein